MTRRGERDPYTKDRFDPLQLIARMLVGGSYRVPAQGGKGTPLRAADIAAAVGYMRDPVERRIVVAVATRATAHQIAQLSLVAYRRVLREVRHMRPMPVDLSNPADRWRVRMTVYAAATEIVWPERRRPLKTLARECNMRAERYAVLHRNVSATLHEAMADGRRAFVRGLR